MCCLSCVLTLKWLSIFCIVQAPGLGEMEEGLNQKEFRFHRQECTEEVILVMVATYGERSWVGYPIATHRAKNMPFLNSGDSSLWI